jgi:hypothetical protein
VANAGGFTHEGIWRDKHWRKLSRSAQCTYMQLLSQKEIDCAGILPLQADKWAQGCDAMSVDDMWADLNELQDERFFLFDLDTFEGFVRSYMRHSNVLKVPNMLKSALRSAVLVASDVLRVELAAELRRTERPEALVVAEQIDPSGTPPEPFGNPSGTVDSGNPSRTLPEPTGVGMGKGTGVTSVGGYVGERRPDCSKHEMNYEGGHCRPCQKRREWDDAHEADELDAKRQLRESRHAAMLACKRCDKFGWALDDTDMPIEPAVKCTIHLQEVS